MKSTIVIIITLLFTSSVFAQQWQWANGYGGSGDDKTKEVVVDGQDNVIATGNFTTSGFSIGSYTFTNKGSMDCWLAKWDPQGQLLWAKQIASSGDEEDMTVAVDKDDNIFLFTQYGASFNLGSTTLPGHGNYDLALIKYDKNGNMLWAKSYGGSAMEEAFAITTDDNGNVYLGGRFISATLSFDLITLTKIGGADAFVAKIDPQGKALWAKNFGYERDDRITALDVSMNALYFGGRMRSSYLVFDGIKVYNSHSNDNVDIFVGKFDLNGNTQWVHSYGDEGGDGVFGGCADPDGNFYIGGQFTSSDFQIGMNLLSNKAGFDIWIAKFDKDGNPLWAKAYGGNGRDRIEGLVFENNRLYASGFTGSSDMVTEKGTPVLNGAEDGIYFELMPDGSLVKYLVFGGTSYEEPKTITADHRGGIIIGGHFTSPSVQFGSYTVTNGGSGLFDAFIAKYQTAPVYNLGGQVFVEGFPIDEATAYLYQSSSHSLLDSYAIDTLGYYDFYSLKPDTYRVLVSLAPQSKDYGKYFPTYFGNAITWATATDIMLTADKYDADINMVLKFDALPEKPHFRTFAGISGNRVFVKSEATIKTVSLLDMTGKVIQTEGFYKKSGRLTQPIPAAGIYLVSVTYLNNSFDVIKVAFQ